MQPMMPPMRKIPKKEKPKSLAAWPKYLWHQFKDFFSHLFYTLALVWEAKKSILFILAFLCLLDGVLPVAGAYLSAELLNALSIAIAEGEAAIAFRQIVYLLIAYFVYLFLNKVNTRVSMMSTRIAGELVANHIRLKIIGRAKDIDVASYDRPEFYEKLENANREAGIRPISILSATFNVISATISAASFVAILFTLHPLAPAIIVLMAIPGAAINYVYRNKTFQYLRHRSKDRRQMEYFAGVMTNKDLVKEVRLMDLSDTFLNRYKSVFSRYFQGIRSLILQEGFWHMGISLATILVDAGIFLFVAYNVYEGQMTLGSYALYTGALTAIVNHLNNMVTSTATIYEGTLFIDNVMSFMKEEKKIVPLCGNGESPTRGKHRIEFQNVSFAYPGTDKKVLNNVNFTLESGETTVLVGLNGAGKTTLIKLLTRLYDPTEGKILLDGKDLRAYNPTELYDLFGIIFQDFGKYAVTVEDNIRFGDIHREGSEEDVQQAARDGDAEDFILRLPRRYQTELMRYFEEDGIELSIGQWQKLSIARAFYKKSDILILDEPTASLDPMAEQEVFEQFSRLGKDKITVFVSHRLSSATVAQQILVLDGGKIVECGNHADLMAKHGQYYTLFSTQASRYIAPEGEGNEGKERPRQ